MLNLLKENIGEIKARISIHLERLYTSDSTIKCYSHYDMFSDGIIDLDHFIVWYSDKNKLTQLKLTDDLPKHILMIVDWYENKIIYFNNNSI